HSTPLQSDCRCPAETLNAAQTFDHSKMTTGVGQVNQQDVTDAVLLSIDIDAALLQLIVNNGTNRAIGNSNSVASIFEQRILVRQLEIHRHFIAHFHAGLPVAKGVGTPSPPLRQ